jgi:uncharacterized membrane protein
MPFCFWSGIGSQSWAVAWPFVVLWFAHKIAIWALVITAVVYGVRCLRRQSGGGSPTPLEILKARYARGELARQDFESMRRDLEG